MEIKPTVNLNYAVSYADPDKIAFIRPVLSILIATMHSRRDKFSLLLSFLDYQLQNDNRFLVEILYDDSLSYNIGVKRNKLLEQATGEYIVFIDDDDEISPNYVSLILEACKHGTDCIGINGKITTNGRNERKWFISREYAGWSENNGVYYRTPNHISPVRRELALKAGFPNIAFAEDYEYSMRLIPLLKTEIKIEEPLYHYKYIDQK